MEQFQQVLLNVWQEACRHIEIGQSTANIAAMLARHIPVEQVLVRRIDSVRSGLETVAVGFAEPSGRRRPKPRTDCSPAKLQVAAGMVPPRKGARIAAASDRRFAEFAVVGLEPARRRRVGRTAWAIRRATAACWSCSAPKDRDFRPRTRRIGPTALGAVLGGAWTTTFACARWPPCARPPRPTNARC